MTPVEGTPYHLGETATGWWVMRRTTRRLTAGGAPIVLAVNGPHRTKGAALSAAISKASA